MSQNCVRDPTMECLGLAKAQELERRIGAIEESSRDTHKQIFDRVRQLEDDRTEVKTHYKHIEETLGLMQADVSEIKNRPGKRWKSVIVAAIGVIVGYLLHSIGIV